MVLNKETFICAEHLLIEPHCLVLVGSSCGSIYMIETRKNAVISYNKRIVNQPIEQILCTSSYLMLFGHKQTPSFKAWGLANIKEVAQLNEALKTAPITILLD